MMKRKVIMILIVMLALFVTGCGKPEDNPAEPNAKDEPIKAEREENAEGYPITLMDQAGREVIIEKEPESIVSGYYISTSLLIALDQEDKLVGIENDADKRPVYAYSDPDILKLPSLGTVKEFDLEECALLDPDLVVVPTKLMGVIPALEELGITVLVVNPENEELLNEMILLLGQATNSEETANTLLSYMERKLDELEKILKDAERPKVYFAGNSSFLTTAGPLMYQHSLIENAGGNNVAKEVEDTYWAEVSYEQVLTWNPEYMILAADAAYEVEDVLNDKNLTACEAVKNKRVYKLPNITEPLDSPVPASLLGTLYVAQTLHPDLYTIEQFEETFADFYETFYQFVLEEK